MDKYITADEYKTAKGIDLHAELQDDDDRSHKVERFIKDTTDWCVDYLVAEYGAYELLEFDALSETRQTYFKKGVMEQIQYILNNGLIEQNSGFNEQTGQIAKLDSLALGKTAYRLFHLGGFANI